ncbi:splicing factor, proline- and glutamine-rich-like [Zophobas morio]|uniref:splicing factor, proline- and glutamine-rich-like n=1 Tax=Zophobas morio TaxID=2755281 RepID=UPI0030828AA3
MRTQLITILALIGLQPAYNAKLKKSKRGSLLGDYSLTDSPPSFTYSDDLNIAPTGWKVTTGDFNLNVDLPPPRHLPPPAISQTIIPRPVASYGIVSNSLDKPVMEGQEYIPSPGIGTAILPQMPQPAIPVNAVASNIPASRGAVFLGSGSIGVVSLGNGAYALGSGSLGYSENRSRPRPTANVPVYPPIRATPDLLPAAVPTPLPPQPAPPIGGFYPGSIDFGGPFLVPQKPQLDQNGYEYLPPNRVGFGQPNPPRPPRTRQQFATPTTLQIPQVPQIPNNIQFSLPVGHPSLQGIPILA